MHTFQWIRLLSLARFPYAMRSGDWLEWPMRPRGMTSIGSARDRSSVAVLVDTVVDGARYLLVRMPKLERPSLPKPLPQPQPQRNVIDVVRRVNAAIDSGICDAFLLRKTTATRGFAWFIYFANGDLTL